MTLYDFFHILITSSILTDSLYDVWRKVAPVHGDFRIIFRIILSFLVVEIKIIKKSVDFMTFISLITFEVLKISE
jgi:hypothetical protein